MTVLNAPSRFAGLALFVIGVVGCGLVIGLLTAPGQWYAGLTKPWFMPPPWLFAPVWTVLYVLIGIAGWRIFTKDSRNSSTGWWCAQMALNYFWPPVFFALHQIMTGLIIILALLVAICGCMRATSDRQARWLFAPYAIWVAFAAVLNGAIAWLN